jgi:hypothetical protein
MQSLEQKVAANGGQVERRPHHAISVGTDDDGKRIPIATPLKTLLSDGLRLDEFVRERMAAAGINVDQSGDPDIAPSGGVVALLNLFERFGFAVDFVVRDRLGQLVSQPDLIDAVRSIAIPETPDHHLRILFVAREPDSAHLGEDKDYVGYAHAKVAVVPRAFWNELVKTTLLKKTLTPWFELRAIDVASADTPVWQGLGAIAQWLNGDDVELVRGEARDRRWQTIPCRDGSGHAMWTVPSTLGHRFRVSMRLVSRYEPLIFWADRRIRLVDHQTVEVNEVEIRRLICRRSITPIRISFASVTCSPPRAPDRSTTGSPRSARVSGVAKRRSSTASATMLIQIWLSPSSSRISTR